ncbi:unnamed protein product [Moneuplotes crassus]|uniref:RING-type domain-containing protein n=1 Tax=Euplotes crassus TaxID=5936 RepID=A0AAD2D2S8_EUPCR|nr:unnamed protein product [Moneuplotes crassus]
MDFNVSGLTYDELQGEIHYDTRKKMINRCMMNLAYEIIIFLIISTLFYLGRNEDCYLSINSFCKTSLIVKGGIVIPLVLMIMILLSYNYLNTDQVEMIASLITIPSSGWFCYVASLYFSKENTCKTDAKHLFYLHSILALEAIWFFCKLFLIVILLSGILLSMLIRNYLNCRRSNRQKKTVKEKIFGRKSLDVSFSKINPDEFCIICMEVYKPQDQMIRLPCTQKHFFHSKCIGDWISVTPKCPLCNIDIDASMSVSNES